MSKFMPEIGCVGYTTIDTNITHDGTVSAPGGGAYFAALSMSRQARPVGLVTRVGSDYNSSFFMERVCGEGIRYVSDGKTAEIILKYPSTNDPTDREISVDLGVAKDLTGLDIPIEWLSTLRLIHVSTMFPNQQHAILEFIRQNTNNVILSMDTDSYLLVDDANREVVRRNYELCDIGFVNRLEYELLAETIDSLDESLVKLDAEGAVYMQQGKIIARSGARKVIPVDVTGAGDVFAGAFLSLRYLRGSVQESLDYATHLATESITQKGIKHILED